MSKHSDYIMGDILFEDEYLQIVRELDAVQYIMKQAQGLSGISMLLRIDGIEEIMYNGETQPVYVYSEHGMCATNLYVSNTEALQFAKSVASYNRRIINEQEPMLDGILEDGSRINIIIPPASLAISFTIRRFKASRITLLDEVKGGMMDAECAAFLMTCSRRAKRPLNMLIVGGTASGKTTLLGSLLMLVPQEQRLVVIEDTPELQVQHQNVVRMVSNKEHHIGMEQLLINALRMRPDRIIVGEVRGHEAVTLFNALNTGHDGCLGTLHANTAKDCVTRITNAPMSVPMIMLRALDLIIVLKKDGSRHIEEICEVSGVDVQGARFNRIFAWNGHACVSTGIPSGIKTKLAAQLGTDIHQLDHSIQQLKEKIELAVKNNRDISTIIA